MPLSASQTREFGFYRLARACRVFCRPSPQSIAGSSVCRFEVCISPLLDDPAPAALGVVSRLRFVAELGDSRFFSFSSCAVPADWSSALRKLRRSLRTEPAPSQEIAYAVRLSWVRFGVCRAARARLLGISQRPFLRGSYCLTFARVLLWGQRLRFFAQRFLVLRQVVPR